MSCKHNVYKSKTYYQIYSTSNPQLSLSTSLLHLHILSLLNLQINWGWNTHFCLQHPYPTMWLEAIYNIIPISCRHYPKSVWKTICVSIITGIDIQHIPPWCPDPLGWYRDKPEDKRFYATCCIESELLYVKSLNNGLVKVTDKCCKKKEHCVLCHEGFGQSVPPETIVHIIEDTLDFIIRFLAMA